MGSKYLPNTYNKFITNNTTFDFDLLDKRVEAIEFELSNTEAFVVEAYENNNYQYTPEELEINKKLEEHNRAKVAILVLSDMLTKLKLSNDDIIALFKFSIDQILLVEELKKLNNYEGDFVLIEDLFFIVKLLDKLSVLHDKDIELEVERVISIMQNFDREPSKEDIISIRNNYTKISEKMLLQVDSEIEARRIYKETLLDTYELMSQSWIEEAKEQNELKIQLFKRMIENAIGFARINNLYIIHIKFILLSLIFDLINAKSPLGADISFLDKNLFKN